ncbi:MAG: hypothetical protein H6937_10200 [Burkholderiales bacterium]|nr:hypothetical protein [Burkholderiales bacterium]MDR4516011.1 hypothetical protein [Nitrosomonas sp.]
MKRLTGIILVLIAIGFTANSTVWARGGGHGSSIGSFGGGGGGHFRGGGGHSHFGGGHSHFGHRHNRFNFGIGYGGFYGPGFYGPGFYGPAFYGARFYGYPYNYGYGNRYYYPRSYGYPSSAIAASPPVYIQREMPVATSTQPQTNYWHYCRNPEGYYPYVKQCPEGWLQVAPQPAPQ